MRELVRRPARPRTRRSTSPLPLPVRRSPGPRPAGSAAFAGDRGARPHPHPLPALGPGGPAAAAVVLRRRRRRARRRTPRACRPRARGSALVVTVHDLAFERFPERVPARRGGCCTAPGVRAAARRADAILMPSRRHRRGPAARSRTSTPRRCTSRRWRRRCPPPRATRTPALDAARHHRVPTCCSWARWSRARTWCRWCAPTGRSRPTCPHAPRPGRPDGWLVDETERGAAREPARGRSCARAA